MYEDNPGVPMKWYKFLIYFLLFFSAIFNVYNAINTLTGKFYGSADEAAEVYSAFPSLKFVDVVSGILFIMLAVICIITRQKLRNFSKNGPIMLYGLYAFDLIFGFVYILVVTAIIGISLSEYIDSSFIKSISRSIAMIALNMVYFKKREHMFIY